MFPALLAVIIAIAAAVTVRVLPDHGAVPDLLGPEVVPDRLVLSDPRDLRENLVYRDIQGQSELLVLLVQPVQLVLPVQLALPALLALRVLLVQPAQPVLPVSAITFI